MAFGNSSPVPAIGGLKSCTYHAGYFASVQDGSHQIAFHSLQPQGDSGGTINVVSHTILRKKGFASCLAKPLILPCELNRIRKQVGILARPPRHRSWCHPSFVTSGSSLRYIPMPMPPMPPPMPPIPPSPFSSGASAIMASVVSINPAIEAAFWRA